MTNMPHFNINTDFLKENTRSYSCGFLRYFHFLLLNASFELSAVVTLKFNFNNKKNVILWILIILHRWQQRLMGINIFRRSWRTEHDSSETRVEIIKTSGRSLSFFWVFGFVISCFILKFCLHVSRFDFHFLPLSVFLILSAPHLWFLTYIHLCI